MRKNQVVKGTRAYLERIKDILDEAQGELNSDAQAVWLDQVASEVECREMALREEGDDAHA